MDDEEYMTVFHVDLVKRKCCNRQSSVYHLINRLYHGELFNNDFTFVSQVHWDNLLGSLSERIFIELNVVKENGFLDCAELHQGKGHNIPCSKFLFYIHWCDSHVHLNEISKHLKDYLHVGNSILLEVNEANVVSNIGEFCVGDEELNSCDY